MVKNESNDATGSYYNKEFIVHDGWKRIFKIAFKDNPLPAFLIFSTGVFATLLEMAAFGVIIFAINNLTSGDATFIERFELNLEKGSPIIFYTILAFAALKLSATMIFYGNAVLVAKYRRDLFVSMARKTVAMIRDFPNHPYVKKYGIKYLPRVLRREARYTSRAVSDAFQLPRHLIIVSVLFMLGLVYLPIPIIVTALIVLGSLPFHIIVSRWGAHTMDDLIDSGIRKGITDRQIIKRILKSPFIHDKEFNAEIENEYVQDKSAKRFFNAYGNRAKLTPRSQLVSSLTFLCIFIALGIILFNGLISGAYSVATVTALVIALRFISASVMAIAQIITNIASYSPLISELLDFLYANPGKWTDRELTVIGEKFSKRVILITKSEIDIHLGSKLNKLWGETARPMNLLADNSSVLIEGSDINGIGEFLETEWSGLSDALKTSIMDAASGANQNNVSANQLILLWLATKSNPKSSILWEARGFNGLGIADRHFILNWTGNRKTVICFPNIPKSLPDYSKYVVWLLIDDTLFKMCRAGNFQNQKSQIADIYNSSTLIDFVDSELAHAIEEEELF